MGLLGHGDDVLGSLSSLDVLEQIVCGTGEGDDRFVPSHGSSVGPPL